MGFTRRHNEIDKSSAPNEEAEGLSPQIAQSSGTEERADASAYYGASPPFPVRVVATICGLTIGAVIAYLLAREGHLAAPRSRMFAGPPAPSLVRGHFHSPSSPDQRPTIPDLLHIVQSARSLGHSGAGVASLKTELSSDESHPRVLLFASQPSRAFLQAIRYLATVCDESTLYCAAFLPSLGPAHDPTAMEQLERTFPVFALQQSMEFPRSYRDVAIEDSSPVLLLFDANGQLVWSNEITDLGESSRDVAMIAATLHATARRTSTASLQPAHSAPSVSSGAEAAPLDLADLPGEVISLHDEVRTTFAASFAGLERPLLFNFWGTWCPPCRAELPHLQELSREYDGTVVVVGLAYELTLSDPLHRVRQVVAENELSYPQYLLSDGSLYDAIFSSETESFPAFALFDQWGRLVYKLDNSLLVGGALDRIKKEIEDLQVGQGGTAE